NNRQTIPEITSTEITNSDYGTEREGAHAPTPAASQEGEYQDDDEEETQKREAFMVMVRGLVAQANEKSTNVTESKPKRKAKSSSSVGDVLPDKVVAILDKWDEIH